MSSETVAMTKKGYENLLEEYEKLKKVERPNVIEKIKEAREHGDLKENAEYHAAKERQSFIETRIQYLEDRIARAEIIEKEGRNEGEIAFGDTVTLIDLEDNSEETYTLVGTDEADPVNDTISTSSPIGKAVLGRRVNDTVKVNTPGGEAEFRIKSVS